MYETIPHPVGFVVLDDANERKDGENHTSAPLAPAAKAFEIIAVLTTTSLETMRKVHRTKSQWEKR